MNAREKQFLTKKFSDYQNGELSDPEKKIIDDWFDAKMEDAEAGVNYNNLKAAKLQQELFANIRQTIRHDQTKINWFKKGWLQVACTLLIVSGLSFFLLTSPNENKPGPQMTWQSYSTSKAEVKKVVLPDGTTIWMNAETRIRLSSDFGTSGSRKLQMDYGEAFFQVKRDTLKPFSITTRNFVTTVLGTSFNIKSYPELKSYQVAVASGKVKVDYHSNGNITALSSGLIKDQVLTYNHDTQKASVLFQNAAHLSAWKSDRSLYFENLTLEQIGAELSRHYNIEVKISGPQKAGQTYTMQLEHQEIQTVLRQIVLKTGISYQLNHKVLTLNPEL